MNKSDVCAPCKVGNHYFCTSKTCKCDNDRCKTENKKVVN